MSVKAIIFLPLVDKRTPPMGKFYRSDKYDNHIWEGREYDLTEPQEIADFNTALEIGLDAYPGRTPRPKPLLIYEKDVPEVHPSHLEVPIELLKRKRGRPRRIFVPSIA